LGWLRSSGRYGVSEDLGEMLALVYGVLRVGLSALVGVVWHSLRPYGMPLLIRGNDSVGGGVSRMGGVPLDWMSWR
jgi:hypothetical protein